MTRSMNSKHPGESDERRVLISTIHPLGANYGGLIQAYALQYCIKRLGFNAATINSPQSLPRLRFVARHLRRFLWRVLRRPPRPLPLSASQIQVVREHPLRFISERLETLDLFTLPRSERSKVLDNVHALVVGSDQVWRYGYTNVSNQLLKFARGKRLRRISYAASFGTDKLSGYPMRLQAEAKQLISHFDAVSVREDSGVGVCATQWGVHAEHHVDPAMLLGADHYRGLIDAGPTGRPNRSGGLFTYVLDRNPQVESVLSEVQGRLQLTPFEVLSQAPSSGRALRTDPDSYRMKPVEQWLEGFATADFVLTDSFHGTVMAIIFNKPFLVLGNHVRGMARFTSLLEMFGLAQYLVDMNDDSPKLIFTPPDWSAVNSLVAEERTRALAYLAEALGERQ